MWMTVQWIYIDRLRKLGLRAHAERREGRTKFQTDCKHNMALFIFP